MKELFTKDYQFALATAENNIPSLRYVDTYYEKGCFYVVTYATSQKMKDIINNPNIALCSRNMYAFSGKAYNIGHPLKLENTEIRKKLIKVFEPWYFKHNNEENENMCYLRIELTTGFVHKDGIGYKIDFVNREAVEFPFTFDTVITEE